MQIAESSIRFGNCEGSAYLQSRYNSRLDVRWQYCCYFGWVRADFQNFHSIRASNMDSKRYGKQIWLNSKLSFFAKAVIANSKNGALHHVSRGFQEKKMKTIFNGIDSNQYFIDRANGLEFRKSIGLNTKDIVFLYVARVDPMKGHDFLISVAKACPKFKFIFVGNGTRELELPKNVIPLGIKNEMRPIYNSADWGINWSHFGEGFPNVIGEAMACGLPVYSNDVGDSGFYSEIRVKE